MHIFQYWTRFKTFFRNTRCCIIVFFFFNSTESGGVADKDENNLFIKICLPTEGFHVTSYQANFASHHTHDHHIGFLSPVWYWKIQQNVPVHIIIPSRPLRDADGNYNLSDKNISTQTRVTFKIEL